MILKVTLRMPARGSVVDIKCVARTTSAGEIFCTRALDYLQQDLSMYNEETNPRSS